ncbi:zinc-binding dehydrogenase [Vibrio sp. D404a]|uniref:zinc-binding dehydrogenase n=1 Tax=unclassified Vibrio TaxID=2614977 RepID=UPI00255232B8|nr:MULTISPECIES: zinc-binding dehydrogenase [unclassified Vibrio]MDK9736833.1 zinc-binding dehydrogenase [Vibrio sp. D404a]MDK9795749.1 zinc-binding dehydrogenase [Vibrio sp. D449a]
MKAITYQKSSDTFSVSELPTPNLESEFDVLVKVVAVALNPVDAKINLWHEMVPNMDDQFVGGLDVSGEIIAVGSKVDNWQVGDKVLYHGNMRRTHGGFAEFAIQDSRTLVKHPAISAESAASIPCAAWTAYRGLVDKLNASHKESILITGGSGGVGSFAIQIAKALGVKTIITTCSQANHEVVRQLGATHVIDYRNSDVVAEVMKITQDQGVDIALDCVGGDNDKLAADVLAYEGEMVELVQVVTPERYDNAFLKALSFHQLSLGSGHVNGPKGMKTLVDAGNAVNALVESGDVVIPNLKVITLDEVGDALLDIRNQRTVGKIIAKLTH